MSYLIFNNFASSFSQIDGVGLPACIEMCIRALQMESDDGTTKATVCKTISCLLPTDLEVKRACQLTEFLLEPTVDSYYAVETLYNEPDQKIEEENMPIPNSLRCELLLVLKTQWPFDPEFWDWKTLKRHCLALMGEEASIVSSIDLLNDTESPEEEEDFFSQEGLMNFPHHNGTCEEKDDKKQKNREMKKLREKGFISARFRNWQAYMQYCVLCDKEFLGHRIVRHAQIHLSGGVYSCPICAQTFTSKDALIPHVTSHVKQSCKERLTALKTNKKLADPKTPAPVVAALQAKIENKPREIGRSLGKNGRLVPRGKGVECCEDNICPVEDCRRSFKFFKNLIAHVKGHGDDEEAKTFLEIQKKKVVCQYCRRHFVSVTHLNDHLQVHCGVKPYICIQLNCKASFLSNAELLLHRKTHPVFKARCMFPNCGKVFNAAFKLYDHEAHHYKTFTCNAVDCGKVFHSQQQLDLHQEQHVAQEQSPTSELSSQNVQHVPSLIEQMLSNTTPLKQESWNSDIAVFSGHEAQPMPIAGQSSQTQADTFGQYQLKQKPQNTHFSNSHPQILNNSVIQPINSHFSDLNRQKDGSAGHPLHYTVPQNQLEPPFERNVNASMNCSAVVLQAQPPMFPVNFNPHCNLGLPRQPQPGFSSGLSTVSPPKDSIETAMSQPLPPTVAPQLLPGNRPENSVTSSTTSGPPPGLRERYHCPFETCTRHYSSYRSATKHMKTVHSDFYEHWKVARTQIKVTYAPAQNTPSAGRLLASLQNQHRETVPGVQRQNVIQSPPYTNMGASSNYAPTHSHPLSAHNQNTTLLMENVLNPIVLSQLRSDTNLEPAQSQVSGSHNWITASAAESEQIPIQSPHDHSQVYASNIDVMPQVDPRSARLHVSDPSCSMGPTMNPEPECLQSPLMEDGPQSMFPLYAERAKEASRLPKDHLPQYTSQRESSLVSGSRAPETLKSMQNQAQSNFPSSDSEVSNTQTQNGQVDPDNPENQKRSRRSRRTKWPAILKDGKFVCCRCFREFNSPKSLGGHLSKRLICKPYEESELNADLPASFLDLLNSEQTVNSTEPRVSYNPAALYQEKPQPPVISVLTPKDYPTHDYPQNNLPAYENGESNEVILKQMMSESNLSELFLHSSAPQPLFQNPVPYGPVERLPGSSVIQHTENVQLKRADRRENNSCSTAQFPQQSVDMFAGSEFPEPLLSQVLAENSSTAVHCNGPTNHVTPREVTSKGYQSETAITTPDSNRSLSPLKTTGNQIQMQKKTNEQDIRKRLREQILAGDFQRRNSLCLSGNTDPNATLKNPMSCSSLCSPSIDSGFHQMSFDAKTSKGQVVQQNSSIIPRSSSENDQVLNTQSFTCFRESSTPLQEVLSSPGIVAVDTDPEPAVLSATQHRWMTEIQTAFERLDLVREQSKHILTSVKQISSTTTTKAGSPQTDPQHVMPSVFVKPFACDSENCTFSSMSGEALWKHLSKTHNYTFDMVNTVKKRYGQYALFKCQKCTKTFTRNSNLRVHYQSAHKLSPEEIADLDMKRRLAKAAASAAVHNLPVGKTTVTTAVKREYSSPAFVPHINHDMTNMRRQGDSRSTVIHPLQTASMNNQAVTLQVQPQTSTSASAFQSVQAAMAAKQQSHEWQRNLSRVPALNTSGQQVEAHLIKQSAPLGQALSAMLQVNGSLSVDKQSPINRHPIVKPSIDANKKPKEKRSSSAMSPYRPYRCVHQGCVAAFTIQHNLILHYRAVHQSALSALEVNKEQDQSEGLDEIMEQEEEEQPEDEFPQMSEFRCQVKDCSRVFQDIPNLVLHYLQLHEFSLEKAGALLSGIKPGKFTCSLQGCTAFFTTVWRYTGHIKEQHKDLKLSKREQLNSSFMCEIEGCDRSYATKSNLLRHVMKKHHDLYQHKINNQQEDVKPNCKTLHYQLTKTSNGKENIESNKKILDKGSAARRVSKLNNHWTKYGNPSLKTKVEASAMCIKMFPLQYPCMIKGCDSVMKSERSILRHYMGHGLSEKYLEQQRSHFIFCKKIPRQKCKSIRSDDSKSDNTSDLSDTELTPDTGLDGVEYGFSKPVLRKRATGGIPSVLFDSKLSNDESSDGSVVLRRKRGRPRKLIEKIVKRKKIPRTTKMDVVYSRDDESDSSCPAVLQQEVTEQSAPLASFKPMGFEMSFLKFLEQSNKSEYAFTQKADETRRRSSSVSTKDTCVRFRNRLNFKSLGKVKIIIEGTFSGVANLMLKQLQDMEPTVVLDKK